MQQAFARHYQPETTLFRSRTGYGYHHPFLCISNNSIVPNPEHLQQDWVNLITYRLSPFYSRYDASNSNSLIAATNESGNPRTNDISTSQRNHVFTFIRLLSTAYHTGTTSPSPPRDINPPRHLDEIQRTALRDAYRDNRIVLEQQINSTCDALLSLYNAQTNSNLAFRSNESGALASNLEYGHFARLANDTCKKLSGSFGGVCFSWPVKTGPPTRPKNHTKIFYHQFKTFRNIIYFDASEVRMTRLCHRVQEAHWAFHRHYVDDIHGVEEFHNLIVNGNEEDEFITYAEYRPQQSDQDDDQSD